MRTNKEDVMGVPPATDGCEMRGPWGAEKPGLE